MLDANHPMVVQTTSHIWDGDIQEFNNLPPRGWWRAFYATVVFSVFYWIVHPAWPFGGDYYTKGILNKIEYQSQGVTVYAHWNTRALLLHTLQQQDGAAGRKEYLEKITAASPREIVADVELMAFSRSLAKRLFGDNCVSCHGNNVANASFGGAWFAGGIGLEGFQQTIENGIGAGSRGGWVMPAWKNRLSVPEIKALAVYASQLSSARTEPTDKK